MSLSDIAYRPFENLVRPLDIPYEPMPGKGPFTLLMHFVAMFRGLLVAITMLAMLIEGLNLVVIWALAEVVDGVTEKGASAFLAQDWRFLVIVGLASFPVLPILIFLLNTLQSQSLAVSMPVVIQWHGHKAVERQDLAFFHDLFAGQVASRLSQVASAVQSQIIIAFRSIPFFAMRFIGSMLLLGAIAWQLAVPVFLWIVANVALVVWAVPRFSQQAKRSAKRRSLLSGKITDVYGNIQMVKQFAAEDSEAGALRKAFDENVRAQQLERRLHLTTDIAVVVLIAVLSLSILAISFRGMLTGTISIGEFVAAVYISQRLGANAREFLGIGQQLFSAVGTISDAMPVMTTPPSIVDMPGAPDLKVTGGEIVFDDVNFAYRENRQVISGLSLTIAAGEKVGLVGLSGAGKTTLVSLLLRFYDTASGTIRIDGQDIRSVTQTSLRAQIGVISQDVSLLHRSVGDNILYGRPDASRAEIEQAARAAQADEFIATLEDKEGRKGYDAFVGDRGIKLSGGQRQRVAIARVLLKNAPILVLDEATSALDSESEAAVQEKLADLMQGKTVLAIAHRLSTISEMDRIIVIDSGRILESGTPDELLKRDGLYARLWKRQTGGFIATTLDD